MINVNYVSHDITKAKTEAFLVAEGVNTPKGKAYAKIPTCNDVKQLRNYVSHALDRCLDKGIKSVTIAPLGMVNHSYQKKEIYTGVIKEAFAFANTHPEDELSVDITFFDPNLKKKEGPITRPVRPRKVRASKASSSNDNFLTFGNSNRMSLHTMGFVAQPRRRVTIKMTASDHITNLVEYLDVYMRKSEKLNGTSYETQQYHLHFFLGTNDYGEAGDVAKGKKLLSNYKYGAAKAPSHKTLFIIAMALRMNGVEANQLYQYFGAALSPIFPEDQFFQNWIDELNDEEDLGDDDMTNLWFDLQEDYEKQLGDSLYPLTKGARKPNFGTLPPDR